MTPNLGSGVLAQVWRLAVEVLDLQPERVQDARTQPRGGKGEYIHRSAVVNKLTAPWNPLIAVDVVSERGQ